MRHGDERRELWTALGVAGVASVLFLTLDLAGPDPYEPEPFTPEQEAALRALAQDSIALDSLLYRIEATLDSTERDGQWRALMPLFPKGVQRDSEKTR